MNRNVLEKIGNITCFGTIQITDPCYDVDCICNIKIQCEKGEYEVFIKRNDDDRIAEVYAICNNDTEIDFSTRIGSVGVDSGLCGFYVNKPNFSREEWSEFCDKIKNDDYLEDYNGVCCSSGWGDGRYNVYTNKELNAFMIKFI